MDYKDWSKYIGYKPHKFGVIEAPPWVKIRRWAKKHPKGYRKLVIDGLKHIFNEQDSNIG